MVKNDRQAMKILGLLENSDKKEVFISSPNFYNPNNNLDPRCQCPLIL